MTPIAATPASTPSERAAQAMAEALRSGAEQLDLHGLGLKELPPWPAGLSGLRRLNLSGNRLTAVPAPIWALAQLDWLDLGGNRLATLDAGIGQLAALRWLDLSENRLAELPATLAGCVRLQRLDLFGNQFTTWPAAVQALPTLAELDLAGNRLDALPDLQGALPMLATLDLAGNRLTEVGSLVHLPALAQVNLDDNRIAALPEALQQRLAGRARALSADGNPLAADAPVRLHRLHALVSGGPEPGKRYFDAPLQRFGFGLVLSSRPAVARSVDLYFKGFAGAPVSLTLDHGTQVDLARLSRKAALALVAATSRGVIDFAPTNDAAVVAARCEFAERTLAGVGGAALVIAQGAPTERVKGADPFADIDHAADTGAFADTGVIADFGVTADTAAFADAAAPDEPAEPAEPADLADLDQAPPMPLPLADRSAPPPAGLPPPPDAEPVDAAVFCPPTVARSSVFLVQVFLYPPAAVAEVDAEARQADPAAERRGTYALPMELPRGTRVDLHLDMPGLDVAEPDAVLVWRGRRVAAQFEVAVPAAPAAPELAAAATVIGRVRIAVAGMPAGTLRFQVALAAAGTAAAAADARALRARRYRRAFVSYSSKDRAEVLRRVQAFRIAGISVFQDILDLDPGERWEQALYREIDTCDVFLLFWSRAAAESKWVGKEIDYALARKGVAVNDDEHLPDIQPVPIEGPPIPHAPPALGGFHFNDALLAQIMVASAPPAAG